METPSVGHPPEPADCGFIGRSSSPRMPDNGVDNTPHAAHHRTNAAEEEDEQPTPRIPLKAITSSSGDPGPSTVANSVPTNAIPSDTPVATRLRALIPRVPLPPPNVSSGAPEDVPSESDSDHALSRLGSSTTGSARENLRDLFSRALRDSRPTPQNRRQAQIEISPISDREDVGYQSKRRSWSDEEADIPRLSRESDNSARSSHATTFNTLRVRLASSQSQIMDILTRLRLNSSVRGPPRIASTSSRQLDPSLGTPPMATSTPQQSLASEPNLLEQDSVMQGSVVEMLDSETQVSPPPSNLTNAVTVPAISGPFVKANSIVPEPKPVLSSREPSSSNPKIEGTCTTVITHHIEGKRNSQRERDWNRHTPGRPDTPNHHHHRIRHDSPTHVKSISHDSYTTRGSPRSPLPGRLNRRGSVASLSSFDDDFGSRPSSRSSLADNGGFNYERERDWNRPHLQSRPSSSLSVSSHGHAHLHPPRPLSATPYQTRTLASLQRQSSRSSLRSSSPVSLASRESLKEQEEEEKREVVHERERNWNSPRPKWGISKRHSLGSSGSGGISPPPHRLSNESIQRFSVSSHEAPHPGSSVSQAPDQSNCSCGSFRLWLNQSHEYGSPSRHSHSPTKTPAAASKFGWHFHRQPLPPLELDRLTRPSYADLETSSPPSSRASSRASGIIKPSMIPVRAVSKAIRSDGHSIPMTDHLLPNGSPGRSAGREDVVLASDEESIVDFLPSQPAQSQVDIPDAATRDLDAVDGEALATDPLDNPHPEGAPLSSQSPRSSGISLDPSLSAVPASFTPPGTPPPTSHARTVSLEPVQHGILSTPPRRPPFSSAVLHLRTPSPPRDLPDLPDPPSSDDNISNGTPPPGAWAATPQQINPPSRTPSPTHSPSEESTPNLSATFIPLPRDGPPTDKQTKALPTENGFTTPQSSVRTNTLPLQTPAPPGAWVRTPSQPPSQGGADESHFGTIGRRRSFLKVRFDISESEASTAGDQPRSPLSAIRLSNPNFPEMGSSEARTTAHDELSETAEPSSIYIPFTPIPQHGLPSPKPLRKSPMVRVHDAEESNLQDSFDQNNYADASLTPGSSTVRIVDAMGRAINEQPEQRSVALFNDISITSDDLPPGRAETITRIKQVAQQLQEGFSDADRSLDEPMPSSAQLEKLKEVSRSARTKRDQLNLQRGEMGFFLDRDADKITTWSNRPSADALIGSRKLWNRNVLLSSRYAHTEARRLFYTTYYDPLYPELYSLDGSPFFQRAHSSHSWTILDSWETIRREGWRTIGTEIQRMLRWGEQSYSSTERPT
ncbi:hypothetical protein BKA83DRAFT_4282595 [Pisolithus microcarpus]|nr:hypothetical protein BKA83DRAFT_4282595 [Pisolithus microcarpus]